MSRRATANANAGINRAVSTTRKSISTAGSIFAPGSAAKTRPNTQKSSATNETTKSSTNNNQNNNVNLISGEFSLASSLELDDPTLSYSNRGNPSSSDFNNNNEKQPLTLAELENGLIPSSYQTSNITRHIKDEIDELLYQLQVKDKEIRMSRGTVEKELNGAKRNTIKLSRDVDDLMRQQQRILQKQSQIQQTATTTGSQSQLQRTEK